MEKKTTHRIIGVSVVIALVVILMPLLFGGNHNATTQTASVKAPPFPDQDEQTTPTRVTASADNASQAANPSAAPAIADPSAAPTAAPQALTSADATGSAQDPLHPQALAEDTTAQMPQNTNDMMQNNQPGPAAPMPSDPSQAPMDPSAGQPGMQGQQGQQGPQNQQQFQQPGQGTPATPGSGIQQAPGMPGQPLPQNQPVPPNQMNNAMPQAPALPQAQPLQQPQPLRQAPSQPSAPQPLPGAAPAVQPATPLKSAPTASNQSSQNNLSPVSDTVIINADGKPSVGTDAMVTPATALPSPDEVVKSVKTAAVSKSSKHNKPVAHAHKTAQSLAQYKQPVWVVQMGSFHNKGNAQRLADSLRAKGFKAFTREVKSSMRVYVGPEFKQASAATLADKIQQQMNLQGIVVTYRPLEL